ncbi:MAG: tRNA (cytidine(34)-2'-O)-methyltransferase [Rhodospirillales bacterium]|nr:tRNA (cytidine(34)-2'-O)-methyltransferase [Rhodospirillales bacterium]
MIRLALYQPDIPQNTGAAIRLCACMGMGLDIIEPCGFPWDDAKIRRSAMDYIHGVDLARHESWAKFQAAYPGQRRILMTTKAAVPYVNFDFQDGDILIAGRESAGVPDDVHDAADGRVLIPMKSGMRSLNVINACAMISGEALRQVDGF